MVKKIVIAMFFVGGFVSFVSATAWNLPGVTIVTRAQWGANETWRYSTQSKTERDAIRQQETDTEGAGQLTETAYQGQMATDFLIEKTPSEQTVDEYRESSSGNFLKWPESIHKAKSKIIIHHTADDNSALLTGGTEAAMLELQRIYKYHALTKGRGDIGYNFLIDPFGNVYEGRAGGAGVVGAQTAWNNTPSVGISLMGNFNIQVPTDASLKALLQLTTALAKKYKINPKATTSYFKKSAEAPYLKEYTNYTVAGHEDAGITSCPGVNLYNLLPDLRDQVAENLTKIRLVSSRKPVAPKVDRGIIVDGRYYSDKSTDTFTLPIRWTGIKSCTTSDTSITINSCAAVNNQLTISLTKKGTSGLKTISVVTSSGTKMFSMKLIWQDDFGSLANRAKQDYMNRKGLSDSAQNITKITSKVTLSEVNDLIQTPLTILLYELSTTLPRYEVSCDGGCSIQADDKTYTDVKPIIETSNGFVYLTLPNFENALAVTNLEISSSSGGLVRVNNYIRKSYGGTPWNSFRGSLIWKKETIKNIAAGKYVDQAVVMNRTSFDNYMKGIAETSDSDNTEKQKLVLLLAKMYTLFYINGKNTHPSIPAGASYQAIDNPDMFQKYVGAGREKTSTMSAKLLAEINNTVVMYNGYVPILPYFSCSAGFTRSAQEKRGWTDTPYLQSKLDFAACFDFQGHGVGLSGKGAQYLAEKGRTLEQILSYYYPGVNLASTK